MIRSGRGSMVQIVAILRVVVAHHVDRLGILRLVGHHHAGQRPRHRARTVHRTHAARCLAILLIRSAPRDRSPRTLAAKSSSRQGSGANRDRSGSRPRCRSARGKPMDDCGRGAPCRSRPGSVRMLFVSCNSGTSESTPNNWNRRPRCMHEVRTSRTGSTTTGPKVVFLKSCVARFESVDFTIGSRQNPSEFTPMSALCRSSQTRCITPPHTTLRGIVQPPILTRSAMKPSSPLLLFLPLCSTITGPTD